MWFWIICIGIEINKEAVIEAKITDNANLNNIKNINLHQLQHLIYLIIILYKMINKIQTVIIIDQPRKGWSTEFLVQLYKFKTQHIICMSCDLVTRVCVSVGMVNIGGYTTTTSIQLLPQTGYI